MTGQERSNPEELLPWYVNGTLPPRDASDVERWLDHSAAARFELRLWHAVQEEARREETMFGAESGWRRVASRLDERKPVRTVRRLRYAVAAGVLAFVGLQALMVWQIARERAAPMYPLSAAPSGVNVGEWHIQLRFRGDATASQIGALLDELHARVVNGPSALGVYDIAVPPQARFADAAALADWMGVQPIVEQSSAPP